MLKALAAGAALVLFSAAATAAPLTQQQLLDLLAKGVSEEVVRSLVERDCVDFKVEAANVAELTSRLPAAVLKAAIDCRAAIDATPPAALVNPGSTPLSLAEVRVVAVEPVVVDGVADGETTSYLMDQIRKRKAGWTLLDPAQLQLRAEAAGGQATVAPLRAVIDAARSLGAQAVLRTGGAASTGFGGENNVTLHLQLVEVNTGKVLWTESGNSKGGGFTRQHAAHMAVRSATRKLPQ
jgi:hypothetical protein